MLADKSNSLYDIGVCDSSIFGDAVKLIVSRKGTIHWYMSATLGSRIPYARLWYDQRAMPYRSIR